MSKKRQTNFIFSIEIHAPWTCTRPGVRGVAFMAILLVAYAPGKPWALPPWHEPVLIAALPGKGIHPDEARAPTFLVDQDDQLLVVDQVRGFLLGRFLAPEGLEIASPEYPGGLGLETFDIEGPPLPPIPLTTIPVQEGFPVTTSGSSAGSPCVADLDHDGRAELILATTEGSVYLLSHDGEPRPGWPQQINDGFYASPSAGDLDGDGVDEIVLGGISGWIYAWELSGAPAAGWPVYPTPPGSGGDASGDYFAAAALADIDRDGQDEVCIAAAQGLVWLLDSDGRARPGWPQSLPPGEQPPNLGSVFVSPAVGDLDDDGTPEIVVASNGYRVHAWRTSGQVVRGWPVAIPHRARGGFCDVAIGDVDGDREAEVVLTSEHGFHGPATVSVVGGDGRLRPGWPYDLPETCNSGPALGDLTGDGIPEIAIATIGGNAAVIVLDGPTAHPLPGWPVRLKRETVNASPVIADLDGDGENDVAVAALSTGIESDAWIWALDKTGEALSGFPIMLPHDEVIRASPVAADLDGDGDLELVAATERLNSLYAWDLAALCDPQTMPWPGEAGSASRQGTLGLQEGGFDLRDMVLRLRPGLESTGSGLEPMTGESSRNLWPSAPADGGEEARPDPPSTIRFDLTGETAVKLVIFDIKRTRVRRLLDHTLPPGTYRIRWDGRNDEGAGMPGGIYFYQISLDERVRTRQLLLLQ